MTGAEQVIHAWLAQSQFNMKRSSVSFLKHDLFSCGHPIAARYSHLILLTTRWHARSTGRHIRLVRAVAASMGLPVIPVYFAGYEMTSEQHAANVEELKRNLEYARQRRAAWPEEESYVTEVADRERELVLYRKHFMPQQVPA